MNLGTVMNQEHQEMLLTLQHRQRTNLLLQTCGSTIVIDDFIISNLTLGTVMNWDQKALNVNLTTQKWVKLDCL